MVEVTEVTDVPLVELVEEPMVEVKMVKDHVVLTPEVVLKLQVV